MNLKSLVMSCILGLTSAGLTGLESKAEVITLPDGTKVAVDGGKEFEESVRLRKAQRDAETKEDKRKGVEVYVANYWNDKDKDNLYDVPKELVGYDRDTFKSNESLNAFLVTKNKNGMYGIIKFLSPQGKLVDMTSRQINKNGCVMRSSLDIEKARKEYGQGTYTVEFYLAESIGTEKPMYIGTKKFDLR